MISERYYRNLAQKISENLLNFVDGKPKSFSKSSPSSSSLLASSSSSSSSNETPVTCDSKPSVSSANTLTNGPTITTKNSNKLSSSDCEAKEDQRQLNLKAYNFPPHFDLNGNYTDDGEHDESEIAMMSFLLDGQLKRYQSSMEAATSYPLPIKSTISSSNSHSKNASTVSSSKPVTRSSNINIQNNNNFNNDNNISNCNSNRNTMHNSSQMISALEANESQNLHNHDPSKCIFICNVCGHGFSSLDAFDEHEINNHPNVMCNYIEMKMEHNIAITLLNWINNSPMGLLKSCKVPDLSTSKTNADSSPCIQCTKCKAKFKTVECLHQHIMTCASSQPPISSISPDSASEKPTRSSIKSSKLTSTSSPELSKSSSSSEFSLSPSKIKSTITPSPVRREKRKVSPALNSEIFKKEIIKDNSLPSKKNKPNCIEPNAQNQETKTVTRCTATKVKSHGLRTRADDKNPSRNLPFTRNRSRGKRKCPNCSRVFKHLGYFERHVKSECPKKDHLDTNSSKPQPVSNKSKKRTSPLRKISTRTKTKKVSGTPPPTETVQSENEYTPTDLQTGEKEDSEQRDNSDDSKEKTTSKSGKISRSAKKFDPWKVKQEYPLYAFKGSPSQHHSCPHCRRGFTYLANYSRHIREDCPIKFQESLKKQIREGFERCLLKTRDALRKTFAQMNIPHPSEEPLISTNEDGSKESID